MDTVSKETRSRIMASVGQRDTKPEVMLRRYLHKTGLRFKKNVKQLPGTPDLVLPKYNACIFVHGCYWHRHGCKKTSTPKSNTGFWEEKFQANIQRDKEKVRQLINQDWRVLIFWECSLDNKDSLKLITEWLTSDLRYSEI